MSADCPTGKIRGRPRVPRITKVGLLSGDSGDSSPHFPDHLFYGKGQGGSRGGFDLSVVLLFFSAAEKPEKSGDLFRNWSEKTCWTLG